MNPRALAVEVLARVEATDAYLNRTLEERLLAEPAHAPRDAAFATELCYGTTRRRMTLDHAIARFSDRRLETLEDRVLAALRLGAYQAFFMRVPARAAVAETVEALKQVGFARAGGFVNAVLRKVTAEGGPPPLPPPSDWVAHVSVRESHPAWLVERWERAHGREQTEAMLAADNRAPALSIRANTRRIARDTLLEELRGAGLAAEPAGRSPSGLVLASPGRLDAVLGYAEGLWQVQDEAAQLVTHHAALPPEQRVWDVCAAPGGKSCHLAEHHTVLSTDLHANKLGRIEAEAVRLGLRDRITVRAHDATTPLPMELGMFDAVLLDAPCTGLGTLRRHPELRYRRKPGDIPRLAALQQQLLAQAQARVKPGGLLVYAVCSPEPEEGFEQVARFVQTFPEFRREPGPTLTDGEGSGFLRTYPGAEGWDGFFAARLRRAQA